MCEVTQVFRRQDELNKPQDKSADPKFKFEVSICDEQFSSPDLVAFSLYCDSQTFSKTFVDVVSLDAHRFFHLTAGFCRIQRAGARK